MAIYLEKIDPRRKDGSSGDSVASGRDTVLGTLDDNYSSDDEHDERWQRSTWFGSFPGATQDANGTLTSFSTTGPTDFNAFVANTLHRHQYAGHQRQWDATDHWSAELDADSVRLEVQPEQRLHRHRCRRGLRWRDQ